MVAILILLGGFDSLFYRARLVGGYSCIPVFYPLDWVSSEDSC